MKKEMIERIRRVLKESMDGLPCVEVIRDNIDIVLYEISRYYNEKNTNTKELRGKLRDIIFNNDQWDGGIAKAGELADQILALLVK